MYRRQSRDNRDQGSVNRTGSEWLARPDLSCAPKTTDCLVTRATAAAADRIDAAWLTPKRKHDAAGLANHQSTTATSHTRPWLASGWDGEAVTCHRACRSRA